MKNSFKNRLEHIEAHINKDDIQKDKIFKSLIEKIDSSKSVLCQIDNSLDIDVVKKLIDDISLLRDSYYRELSLKDVEILTDDELKYIYQSIITNEIKNLFDDEREFMQKYNTMFNEKFFKNEIEASKNYLALINGDIKMELCMSIDKFNVKMDT